MDWSRVFVPPGEIRARLRAAFSVTHPPHLTGVSFALGLFVLALPNLGVGLVVLAAIGYHFHWANPLALSAAAIVLNPLVKGGVFVASFVLGSMVLGSVPGVSDGDVSLFAGVHVVVRLLVGNLIIAVVLAVVGYFLALYGVRVLRAGED